MKFTAELIFNVKAIKGGLLTSESDRFDKFAQKVEGKRIFITLETEKKGRSLNQNAYYFGVVVDLLSELTGFNQDEMHEILKHKFLRQTLWVPKKDGVKEKSIIARSTADLTTKEFEDYLSQIRQWASIDLGCYIPNPNEPLIS